MPPGDKNSGYKRKMDASDSAQDVGAKLRSKLHHGAIEVRRAAKKAKGLEMQKSVKKLRGLRAKDPQSADLPQLGAQLDYLKTLDIDLFANTALKSKLKKDKVLSSNEHITAAITSELSGQVVTPAKSGSSQAKVDAHLLSSKTLASEVSAVITSLRDIINPPPKAQPRDDRDEADEGGAARPRKVAKVVTAFGSDSDSGSDGAGGSASVVFERQVLDEGDEAVDDDGWDSGSINDYGEGFNDEHSDSEDDEGGEGSKDEDEVPSPKKPKVAVENGPATKTATSRISSQTRGSTQSTFLPSLSVGFTRGDSDSEPEDVDEAPKKNRRGQRARRAIWEKKYGKNANHVKINQLEKPRGPHQHPGGVPADRQRQNDRGPSWSQSSNRAPPPHAHSDSNEHATPVWKPKAEEKPLHPSWEAKKKLKEKQNLVIMPAQGKKVVF